MKKQVKITIVVLAFLLVVAAITTVLLIISPKKEIKLDWRNYFFISNAQISKVGASYALTSQISNITDKEIKNVEVVGLFRDKETGEDVEVSENVGTIGPKKSVKFQIILQKEFDTPTIKTVNFDKP